MANVERECVESLAMEQAAGTKLAADFAGKRGSEDNKQAGTELAADFAGKRGSDGQQASKQAS